MVVLDRFYHIIDAPTSTVSIWWKVGHVASWSICAVCGFATALTFGRILDMFNFNCVLNPNIQFDDNNFLNVSVHHHVNHTVRAIELTRTVWGYQRTCDFAQFTPIATMISAVLWGTYFMIMSRGGAGYPTDLLSKPSASLYLCICFSFCWLIVYGIGSEALVSGMENFCLQFQPELNNTGCVREINIYTHQFTDFSDQKPHPFFEFYNFWRMTYNFSSWGFWSWFFQLVLCIVRVFLVTDYELQIVTIMGKDEERVQRVHELDQIADVSEV